MLRILGRSPEVECYSSSKPYAIPALKRMGKECSRESVEERASHYGFSALWQTIRKPNHIINFTSQIAALKRCSCYFEARWIVERKNKRPMGIKNGML